MSRDSYNHLKRHLLENKQNILLNIVQEHLFVDGGCDTVSHILCVVFWEVFILLQPE